MAVNTVSHWVSQVYKSYVSPNQLGATILSILRLLDGLGRGGGAGDWMGMVMRVARSFVALRFELFNLGAVVSGIFNFDRVHVSLVEVFCHFQFNGVLVLDGFLESVDDVNDPVVGRNGMFDWRCLQVVGEVADVTVVCRFCAPVAVWL